MTREETRDHVPEDPLKEGAHLCSPKERRAGAGRVAATVSTPEAWPTEGSALPSGLNGRGADQEMAARLKGEGFDGPRHLQLG